VNGEQKILWKEGAYQLPPGTTETTNESSARIAGVATGISQIQSSNYFTEKLGLLQIIFFCYLTTLLTNALSYFVPK
jgi:hypothetical protein